MGSLYIVYLFIAKFTLTYFSMVITRLSPKIFSILRKLICPTPVLLPCYQSSGLSRFATGVHELAFRSANQQTRPSLSWNCRQYNHHPLQFDPAEHIRQAGHSLPILRPLDCCIYNRL